MLHDWLILKLKQHFIEAMKVKEKSRLKKKWMGLNEKVNWRRLLRRERLLTEKEVSMGK